MSSSRTGYIVGISFVTAVLVVAIVLGLYYGLRVGTKYPAEALMKQGPLPPLSTAPAPKTIWTYWNSATLPRTVQKCIASWRRHHPDYKIVILTPDNVHQYTSVQPDKIPWNKSAARESDIVRIHVLAEHGGVWSDASMLLLSPIPFLTENALDHVEFVGYHIKHISGKQGPTPLIENWWFATRPQGRFITLWRDAFMGVHEPPAVKNASITKRLKFMHARGVNSQAICIFARNYLFMHVAAQYVLQKLLPVEDVSANMRLLKAEDGPFRYLVEHGWNSAKAVQALHNGAYTEGMFKLRGSERKIAEESHHAMWAND
jgi:hypothetical protein